MNFRNILHTNRQDIALIIGNGVNRYGKAPDTNSWEKLLNSLARKPLDQRIPKGIALTEYYDLLELQCDINMSKDSLQQECCNLMQDWKPYDHHNRIVTWAKKNEAPLLTTNFDNVLEKAGDYTIRRTQDDGFTDFYPWETYYGTNKIINPASSFGIWHINGMLQYHRSLRLGLTHYMGSAERARRWIHRGKESSLFFGKDKQNWRGAKTWLHIIFNNNLLIFGLGLDENEVFLRWLLIERAKYFRKFQDRQKSAWYVYTTKPKTPGKLFFLKGVGVKPILASSYKELYEQETWSDRSII